MQPAMSYESNEGNPLAGLISDDVYALLNEYNLLSEKAIRDYQIRLRFRSLRRHGMPASDAITALRKEHPYLQYDTVRKIVYRLGKR